MTDSVGTKPAPAIILGAARSGTKLLRSMVAAASEYAEVPHDVNYVWRTVSPRHPNDALSASFATPSKGESIRRLLNRMACVTHGGSCALVEKTVSNTLRTPLVDAVFPNAKFVHLIRDGWDVTESSLRCWQAPPEYGRLAHKLQSFPWRECAGYALEYTRGIAGRYLSGKQELPVWGPRYPGIEGDLRQLSLIEVCAWQWRRCVEIARADLCNFDRSRWIEIRYEDLVANPTEVARKLGAFLGVARPEELTRYAVKYVRKTKRRELPSVHDDSLLALTDIIEPLRVELGYSESAYQRHAA